MKAFSPIFLFEIAIPNLYKFKYIIYTGWELERRWQEEIKVKKIFTYVLFIMMCMVPLNTADASIMKHAVSQHFDTSNTAVSIRSIQTGKVLFEHKGETPMRPASNLKLLTGAAALHTLGEDYRFSTTLYIDGEIMGTTLVGDIYLKGGGDPTLLPADIVEFAKVLKRQGIRKVNGHIYGDATFFTGPTLSPGVERQDETYYFGARTSALTLSPNEDFDASTVIVTATAGAVGRAPTYSIMPNTAGMKVKNVAKTVAKGQKNTISIKRKYNTNEIIISGNIARGNSKKEWVSMHNPTMNTLSATKMMWQQAGITFEKDSTVKQATVPQTAQLLSVKQSRTLKSLYPTFMKLSNNSIADMLVKTMGQEVYGKGDLLTGLQVMREYGRSIGMDLTGWQLIDGSGLGMGNKITANAQTQLLTKLQQNKTFYTGLPIGGASERLVGGTLKKRFTQAPLKHNVVAKTGYITHTYTLSGYVTAKSGRTFAFSIMTAQPRSAINNIDAFVKSIYSNY